MMVPSLYVATLAGLSIVGMYTLHGLLVLNGSHAMILDRVNTRLIEDGLPWPEWFRSLSNAMVTIPANLLGFFWPVAIGTLPAATVQGFMFGGQLVAQYVLLLVEGSRVGLQGSPGS
jgi:hypothetical protein